MHGVWFGKLLHMSLIGCYSTAVVLAVRLFLKRCGRKYAYYLWMIVFLNLCIPVSLSGSLSLIPRQVSELSVEQPGEEPEEDFFNPEEAKQEPDGTAPGFQMFSGTGEWTEPQEEWTEFPDEEAASVSMEKDEGSEAVPENSQSLLSVTPAGNRLLPVAEAVYLTGVVLLFSYQLFMTRKWNRLIRTAIDRGKKGRRGIVEMDGLETPFLWGVLHPVICLPARMPREERVYVIAHEECHRRRKDHLVKLVIFGITVIHWFNPVVWLAYGLCCKDMEISCDEAVLERSGEHIRKAYAQSLLKYAARQNGYLFTSLTFGEPSVKSRIKNILRYRKRGVTVSVAAACCVILVTAGLFFRPAQGSQESGDTGKVLENDLENHPVINNGGTVIAVDGRICYMDGAQLYSDGEKLYASRMDGEDGSISTSAYLLDGGHEQKLCDGEIVDMDEARRLLYIQRSWSDDGENEGLFVYDIQGEGSDAAEPGEIIYLGNYLYLGKDEQYVYGYHEDASGYYIDRMDRADFQVEENIFGEALPVDMITDFCADEDYLLLAAGEFQGSANVFYGNFYSWEKGSGTLASAHLTDDYALRVYDGYVYYQKYDSISEEPARPGLYRAFRDLTGEELVGEGLTLLALDERTGTLLAAKQMEQADPAGQETLAEESALISDLVRMRPDGSGEQTLLSMADENWEMRPYDKLNYRQINLLEDKIFVKVEQYGYRDGDGWRDELIEERYYQVQADGSGYTGWEPGKRTGT